MKKNPRDFCKRFRQEKFPLVSTRIIRAQHFAINSMMALKVLDLNGTC